MTSLVLPTDNAVIDYSLISQMMTAINNLQTQVNKLTPPPIVDTNSKTPVIPRIAYKVITIGDPGFPAGSNITVNAADLGLTTILSITGTPYTAGGTQRYCWLSSFNGSKAVFTLNSATTAASGSNSIKFQLYVVAVGY
jgi:hypothetical protein